MGAELRFPPTPGMKILDLSWDPEDRLLWWRKQKEQQAGDGLLGAYVLKAGGAQSREQRVMAVWR